MIPLHEELREIRLEKGISLSDISEYTKIRIDLLRQIEEGKYDIVPVPYLRAFLREYAEVVGIDPDIVIARYEKKIPRISDRTGTLDVKPAVPIEGQGESAGISDEQSGADAVPEGKPDSAAETGLPIETAEKDDRGPEDEPQRETDEAGGDTAPDADEPESGGGEKTPGDEGETTEKEGETAPPPSPHTEVDVAKDREPPPSRAGDAGVTRRSRLEIEEPSSSNTVFFIAFLALLIAAAIVIVWMSRSGVF